MKFIKENSSIITRLIITHIAMSVFGLSLFFATNQIAEQFIRLAIAAFSACFYIVIVYSTMWDFGAKDKPAFDAGRQTKAGKKGFLSVLIAEAFWLILAIAYIVIVQFDVNIASMVYFVEFLTSCCFTGIEVYIKTTLLPKGSELTPYVVSGVYILGSLIAACIGAFGYALGTKDLTIIPKKANTKK